MPVIVHTNCGCILYCFHVQVWKSSCCQRYYEIHLWLSGPACPMLILVVYNILSYSILIMAMTSTLPLIHLRLASTRRHAVLSWSSRGTWQGVRSKFETFKLSSSAPRTTWLYRRDYDCGCEGSLWRLPSQPPCHSHSHAIKLKVSNSARRRWLYKGVTMTVILWLPAFKSWLVALPHRCCVEQGHLAGNEGHFMLSNYLNTTNRHSMEPMLSQTTI